MPWWAIQYKTILLFSLGITAGLVIFFWISARHASGPAGPAKFGVTFSIKYANELGLDWKQLWRSALDDLKIRRFRVPVYWDLVEADRGVADWSDLDWLLTQAEERGAEVALVVGRKVPRWPECHPPKWAAALSGSDQRQATLAFLRQEIEHFRSFGAVTVWQVENEPLFPFGKCPLPDRDLLKEEVALVRSLDPRPVMITDSGELSTWARTAQLGDILGISMYRLVWNSTLGFLYWPVSPRYYSEHVALISPLLVPKVIISELQAEPWFHRPVAETPLAEQFETMSLKRFWNNIDYARRTGVSEIYLWGVEWWYWLRSQGHEEFWQAAKSLFSS
jgi:hypothetical protein